MRKVYYEDNYRKTLLSKPQDATIFYPECGGQPGDRGFADDLRIIDTKKAENGDSVYILEDGKTLSPDKEYKFTLDWDHRYRYMKMHTCQHMLSGLLYTMFNIGTVAVHLGEEYLTIEVNQDNVPQETIEALVLKANRVIWEGHKVTYHEKSHEEAEAMGLRRSIKVEGNVRLVEIEDIDIIACGGVQVSNTNEIQMVVYYKQELIRGHVRLFFKCAEDAVKYSLENQKTVKMLSEQLGCSSQELVSKTVKLSNELSEKSKLLQAYAEKNAENLIENQMKDGVASFMTDIDLDAIAKASEGFENIALCALKKTESGIQWIIVLRGKYEKLNFSEIKAELLPQINAKGGGRTPVFRGIALSEDNTLREFLEKFKNKVINL